MGNRRTSAEHQDAISRRLAQLSADVAAARAAPEVAPAAGGEWWAGHTRSAERPSLEVVAEPEPSRAPPLVPVPGRHAARRARSLVPDTLRGRVRLGPAQLAVVAVLVAVGLAVTTWWVVRAEPGQPTAPPTTPGSPAEALVSLASGPVSSAAASGGQVTVDVAGKVRRPGIAVLDPGARVIDAIRAAGGARGGVDLSSLNLARLLVDGEQVLVGQPAAAAVPGAIATPGSAAPTGPLVNLNVATQAELESLPEVGPVTAQAILAWRDQHGGFSDVGELLEVDGIGEATLAQITPYVTI
jgi:competence protein ComEA